MQDYIKELPLLRCSVDYYLCLGYLWFMGDTNISKQLKHDYPNDTIVIDAENQALYVDNSKNVLLLSTSSIERMNIFSSAGRHFYQVIVNLIYTRFDILPKEGSLADSLIIRREDVDEFKLRKISELYKLGFLEDGDEVVAVDFDDDVRVPKLLEDVVEDPLDEDDFDTSLKYYRYSFWRDEDSQMEELEAVDDESDQG